MKAVSKKYFFDDAFLLPKIPPEMRFLEHFDSNAPFFLAPGVLERSLCDRIVEELRLTDPQIKLPVRRVSEEGTEVDVVNETRRNTFLLSPSLEVIDLYQRTFAKLREPIETFFKVKLKASDGLQTLGYGPGCKYILHADTCVVKTAADGTWKWEVSFGHRKISTILFLSDSVSSIFEVNQCVGGDVSFDYLKDEAGEPLRIKPLKGLFIAFPSTPLFSHQVHEVTEGYRVSLVEWYSADLY